MAVGDTITEHGSVANNSSLTIRPGSSGPEWMITNLYMGGGWELYRTDGTNMILVMSGSGVGSLQRRSMIATWTHYFTLKNVSGGAVFMGFDGVVIK